MNTSLRNQAGTRFEALATIVLAAPAMLSLFGCSGDSTDYPSAEGKAPPYILKEDCTFALVGENGRSSVSSPKATGVADESVSASISLGEFSITVSSCAIVENSHGLPIYEE